MSAAFLSSASSTMRRARSTEARSICRRWRRAGRQPGPARVGGDAWRSARLGASAAAAGASRARDRRVAASPGAAGTGRWTWASYRLGRRRDGRRLGGVQSVLRDERRRSRPGRGSGSSGRPGPGRGCRSTRWRGADCSQHDEAPVGGREAGPEGCHRGVAGPRRAARRRGGRARRSAPGSRHVGTPRAPRTRG